MNTPSISDLYEYYDILLNESTALEEKEKTFKSLLLGTKGGEKEKRLACQFIARFSKLFANLQEESFNCILDLCDDDDVNIRKQAVHDLLQFCKRLKAFIPRTADVLVQMFQTDDSSVSNVFYFTIFQKETHMISLGLSQLLHMDPKAALVGIFSQLLTVNPENSRDHVMRFLAERFKSLPENLMTSEVEEFVVEQTNKVLSDVSEDEFQPLISILLSLKCMSTVPGRQKLVGMITEQALQANPVFSVSCLFSSIFESASLVIQPALPKYVKVESKLLFVFRRIQFFGSPAPSSCVSGATVEETSTDQHLGADRLRTLRPRLQYLSNVAQRYAQSIAGHLGQQSQQSGGPTADGNGHLKVMAHRLVTNIQSLVRAFFHNPPTFKSPIPQLSWLSQPPIVNVPAVAVGQKRSSNGADDFSTNPKVSAGPRTTSAGGPRQDLPRYAPPAGVWSRGRAGGRVVRGRGRQERRW